MSFSKLSKVYALKKYYYVLLAMLVVFAAGCTGNGPVTSSANEGIVINSFTTFPQITEAFSGDTVLFDMEIENVGGTTAREVQVDIFGVENQWRDINGEYVSNSLAKEFGTLSPPKPERDVPGDFRLTQWELMTPPIPEGIVVPLTVSARVKYEYNTSGFLIIPAVSEAELQRMRINGESTETATSDNSNGPLKLVVPSDRTNTIVVNTRDTNDITDWPVRIEFQNVGNGFPITKEKTGYDPTNAGGRLRGTIQILGPGVSFGNCLGVTGGNVVNLDDTTITPRMRDTNTVPVGCTIQIDETVWGNRPKDSVTFIFNIFYTYYVDKDVKVDVVGQ